MDERKNFDYDELSDSLIISCKKKDETIKENFMFDDIILSLTPGGKISVIEILNASNYLEEIGVNPNILNNIQSAELKVTQKKDSIVVRINLNSIIDSKIQENKIPLGMIPIRAN